MQRIVVEQDFSLPVERVYAHLAEHENLGPVFGARVERVRDGETARNGVGSVRRLKVGLLPSFEETVTVAEPGERIEYRITRGSPLKDHHGTMVFSRRGTGSHLRYVIEFGAEVPGLDRLIAPVLARSIRQGLGTVDARA